MLLLSGLTVRASTTNEVNVSRACGVLGGLVWMEEHHPTADLMASLAIPFSIITAALVCSTHLHTPLT